MATASSASRKTTRFSAPIGNKELSLELDEQRGQLVFELSDSTRFVVHKTVVRRMEEIRELTGGIVDSPALLYDAIRMLLEEKSPTGSVEFIEKQNILVVKIQLLVIPVTWNIPMERLESTADFKCEFLVKQVEQLTASNKQLTARVKSLEEFIAGTPDKVELPVFASLNVPNYTLSADRKTITRNKGSGTQGFLSEQSIPAMGNRFTLTLTNMGENIKVGVAKRGTSGANGLYSKAGSWMLYLEYKYWFYVQDYSERPITAKNGSQVNELIYFLVDGCLRYTVGIPKPFSDLYAAVDLNEANQSVSFI